MKSIVCVLAFLTQSNFIKAFIDFTVQPESQAILLGSDLHLHCVAADIDDPQATFTYQWLLNDLEIQKVVEDAAFFPNNTLFIPKANLSSLGSYECFVTAADNETATSSTAVVLQAYIDPFLLPPQSQSVESGVLVSLECVTGYSAPPANVSWQKDGVPLIGADVTTVKFGIAYSGGVEQRTSRLILPDVGPEDGGQYLCLAENPLSGETVYSEVAALYVAAAPIPLTIITPWPSALTFPEARNFALDCPVTPFSSVLGVLWYRNTVQVRIIGRFRLLSNGTLSVSRATRADSGLYNCRAYSRLGNKDTPMVNVTIAFLDILFEHPPVSMETVSGQPLTIPCRPPLSAPPAMIQWYKEDTLVTYRQGEHSVSQLPDGGLHFSSVELADAGSYTCEAYNAHAIPPSRSAGPITLSLGSSPRLVQPPLPQTLVRGDLLTLTCAVEGQPQPEVTWFRDSTLLMEDGSHVTFSQAGQELVISSMSKADEATYQCAASNIYGTTTSGEVIIQVIIPPEMLRSMDDVTVTEGEEAVFVCPVYADPQPIITWFHENVPLGSALYNHGSDTLTLLSVTRGQQGTYSCKAENGGGSRTNYAKLHINVPPEFVSFPGDKTVTAGNPVLLYCDAYGLPKPDVLWTYQGTSSSFPPGVDVSSVTLSIASVSRDQAGSYTCSASNSVGYNSKTLSLVVQEIPKVKSIDGDKVIDLGSDLDLECNVEGHPGPDVTWSHNGTALLATQDGRVSFPSVTRLLVRYVSKQDGGLYECVATNPAGHHSNGINVKIRGPPLPPMLESVVPVSMTSVQLLWKPASQDSVTDVTALVVEYKLKFTPVFRVYSDNILPDVESLEVESLSPATDYLFRMAARNSIGQGEYSPILAGRTIEAAPSPPLSLTFLSIEPYSALLQWEVPKVTNGEIRSYQLQHKLKYGQNEFTVISIQYPSLPLQQYNLQGLLPYATYILRIRAATIDPEGSYLWGNFSHPVEMATRAAVPSAAPSKVQLVAMTTTSIQVSWQSIATAAENGPLRGYKLMYKLQGAKESNIILVEHATSVTVVTSLLPWRWYVITIAAYNDEGTGPTSHEATVRTLAEAPVGSPEDVTISDVTSTAFTVTWKPVPIDLRHSDISGYIVLYHKHVELQSESMYINNPLTITVTIRDLSAWSLYTVQVQAFTTQVTQGFGPLSETVTVTTLQDVPSSITALSFNALSTSIHLSWDTPSPPNGEITTYVIMYEVIPDQNAEVSRRRKRSTSATTVTVSDTEYELIGLSPSAEYIVAIAAKTEVGTGPFYNVTVQTADPPPVISTMPPNHAVTINEDNEINAAVQTPSPSPGPSALSDEALIGVIIGCVLVGILLLTVLIILCVLCWRRKNKQQAHFYTPDQYVVEGRQLDPNEYPEYTKQYPRHVRESVPYVQHSETTNPSDTSADTPQIMISQHSPHPSPRRHRHKPRPSPVSHSHHHHGNLQHHSSPAQISSDEDPSQATSVTPVLKRKSPSPTSHGASAFGIDNPAFDQFPDTSPSASASALHPSRSPGQPYTQVNVSKRRKMDRQMAAAIAVQRDRTTSVFADTQKLIPGNNSNVVVYNERTAL